MVNYRRNILPGGTFFFTLTLQDRKSILLVKNIHLFKEAVQKVKTNHPFQIKAYVILPEHIHMIWQLPNGDTDYSTRWKKIKTLFSKSLQQSGVPLIKNKHRMNTVFGNAAFGSIRLKMKSILKTMLIIFITILSNMD